MVFILESPPASGKFFFSESGSTSEPLFAAMMKFLGVQPKTKKEGLLAFKNKGYFLIDSTYVPVNKDDTKVKNRKIVFDIPNLVRDLDQSVSDSKTKIVLVKKNIYGILYGPLMAIGYKVVNKTFIPFPVRSQKNINSFLTKLRKLKI